jgi:hypothetical protein
VRIVRRRSIEYSHHHDQLTGWRPIIVEIPIG